MDFVNQLVGEEGCDVDGSLAANPVAAFADHIFDSHVPLESETMRDNIADHHIIYNEPALAESYFRDHAESKANMEAWEESSSPFSSSTIDRSHGYPSTQMGMMTGPYQQSFYPMGMGYSDWSRPMYTNSIHQNSEPPRDRSLGEQVGGEKQYEVDQHQSSPSSVVASNTSWEQLMNGALQSGQLDEQSRKDLMDFLRQGDNTADVNEEGQLASDGPSKEGYQQAWNTLSDKLESLQDGSKTYSFYKENPYIASTITETKQTSSSSSEKQNIDTSKFELGMKLFKEGRVHDAILAFEADVQMNENHDEGWHMLGTCHAEQDDDRAAIFCLQKCLDCDPYNVDAMLALGTSYVNELDAENALRMVKDWISHSPDFQGLDVTVDEYSDGTLFDEVTQVVLAAQAHSPNTLELSILLGVLYNVSMDYSNAAEQFLRVAEARPQDYATLNKLGATLANNGRPKEAASCYQRALSVRPEYARAWINLGISLATLGSSLEAAGAYIRALLISPKARHTWGYLRMALTDLGRLDLIELTARENDVDQIAGALNIQVPFGGYENVSNGERV